MSADANNDMTNPEQLSLGVDYKFNKKSKVFGFVIDQDADDAADQKTVAGIGLEHKF